MNTNMRLLVFLYILLAPTWTLSESISGMLACNPNETSEKPVIYAFDGEYLIRDNDLEYPFQKIVSLPNKTEMYFAYKPSEKQINAPKKRFLNAFTYFSLLEQIGVLNPNRSSWGCSRHSVRIQFMLADLAHALGGEYNKNQCTFELPNLTLKYRDILSLTKDKIKQLMPEETPLQIENLDQVKLTIDLSKMKVIEEIYSPSAHARDPAAFLGTQYQCQSLGVTVPKIDTSRSRTPIGDRL